MIETPNRHVIIICAGDATRWNNYLGTTKHLLKIDDEPLLHRTVRQVKSHGATGIYVVAKEEHKKEYAKSGADIYVPTFYPEMHDADKFYNSRELWNKSGRTIVLWGDVYFTDEAMNEIMGYSDSRWTLFGRAFANKYTGTPYGECFAQSFYPEYIDQHLAALRRVSRLWKWGLISRCGGWEHYRAMQNIPDSLMDKHIVSDNFVEIHDWTDDFDYPEDYDKFIERWKNR